ncbi:MAG: DUF4190 domain-containing protein [Candidatus Limnocylindria bacterium]
MAIASLILGILAIVPVAIVLGIVALVQIGRRGDDGRGLAIAGIAISCAWVVIAVVAIVVLVDNIVGRDADGRINEAGLIDELSLVPGDCLNDPEEDAILLSALPCEQPHDAEVFARFRLAGDGWPGRGNIRRRATAGCRNRLEQLHPREYGALIDDVTYFSPDRFDWAIDDHDVICFANYASRRSGALDGV